MGKVSFEIPRLTVPDYIAEREQQIERETAPGHKFSIYFKASTITGEVDDGNDNRQKNRLKELADKDDLAALEREGIQRRNDWDKLSSGKSKALGQTLKVPLVSIEQITALRQRQQALVSLAAVDTKLSLEAEATSSLATGMGMEHPLENGFAFLNPYGLPYLPGSSIKGVLRRAAEELAFDENSQFDILDVWFLFGFEGAAGSWWSLTGKEKQALSDEQKQRRAESKQQFDAHLLALVNKPKLVSFIKKVVPEGKEQNDFVAAPQSFLQKLDGIRQKLSLGGALTFWDAIPELAGNTMGMDVMTPHYGDYYQGNGTPHDAGSPNPIVFMVIPAKSKFTFHVTADTYRLKEVQNWQALMQTAFEHAFKWLGFGAKTAVGYGAMRDINKSANSQAKTQQAAIIAESEPEIWAGAKIKFNRANGTLTVEKSGKTANALKPKGEELLNTLAPAIKQKVMSNQFVKVNAYVQDKELVKIEIQG
ncbi:MAG: type III-B CRISPR module RAMP protein Cmr6 [Thiofilum sp.]|uniref:type III-B CRISPR module RAMP protein Cmr6 n=1 Tax=Thiofilum sp. TaxID=2212733 RepID=UPI0025E89905|nr:type III-B CRISPR module RAMP protein Cmr6 [Thiofilum sp.]MBK8455495.1 type III-B CRISPR module RAMP protein Cmr6 [Thiofilum sp.]